MDVRLNGVRYIPERAANHSCLKLCALMVSARELTGETLEESAKAIGTTKSHLWTLENDGGMPRLPMLQKILRHYGIAFDEIMEVE